MFVVAQADNVSYDINVSKPFKSCKEAEEHLMEVFKEHMESFDEEDVVPESTYCKKASFVITTVCTDIFYGSVKEIKTNDKR